MDVPRTKKMSGFFERSKAMFREYSKRTFLEPSIGTFREHLYRTFVELFVGTFAENVLEHSAGTFFESVPGIIFCGIQETFFIDNQMLPL